MRIFFLSFFISFISSTNSIDIYIIFQRNTETGGFLEIYDNSINGLGLRNLLFSKTLDIDKIIFKQPSFEVTLNSDTNQKTNGKGLQSMFGDILSRAHITHFQIENGSVVLMDPISKKRKGQVKKLNLLASHLETDSLKFKHLIPFKMGDLEVTLDSITFELNEYTHVGLSRFQYRLKDKKIFVFEKWSDFDLIFGADHLLETM